MIKLAKQAKENLIKHRAAMATLIQARQRCLSSKKRTSVRLNAGRLLVRGTEMAHVACTCSLGSRQEVLLALSQARALQRAA